MEPDLRKMAQHNALFAQDRQEALDRVLTERLGAYSWDLDLSRKQISFTGEGEPIIARADLIASVAAKPSTLLWGWSPQLAPSIGQDEAAFRLREFGQQHGLPSLIAEEVPYTVEEGEDQGAVIADAAHDIGRIALEVFGPDALYYTFPIGGGSRACVLMRDLPIALPEPRIESIALALGRYALVVDDLAWALDGMVRRVPGWWTRSEQRSDGRTLDVLGDAEGVEVTVMSTRDELGRLGNVEVRTGRHPDPVDPVDPVDPAETAGPVEPAEPFGAGEPARPVSLVERFRRLLRG